MSYRSYALPLPDGGLDHRLILQHQLWRKTLDGRLLSRPLTNAVARVLDVGAGSGGWAADFAKQHPDAQVIALDIFEQPTVEAPSNCQFVKRDLEQDWDIGSDAKFDLIHSRMVPMHATEARAVLRRCIEHLKPGGHIEMQELWLPFRTDEPPGAPESSSTVIQWSHLRLEAVSKLGFDHTIAGQLPDALLEVGFEKVQVQDYKWPTGAWVEDEKLKEIGNMFLEYLQLGKRQMSEEILAQLGMDEQQITDLVEQVGKELGTGKIYVPARFISARRPE
ncbi:hypothetical protein JX265_006148 [Neoarthrinium moseri]|uniref:Methyltransferase domain-containing protein n=1 Tax=Neoarthrinium moseri TaxID=1658444 RepID=A0A9Q0ARA5_9PEZI|nr:hypothetical protein JX265_006148 [Neoarthrinium moseri]